MSAREVEHEHPVVVLSVDHARELGDDRVDTDVLHEPVARDEPGLDPLRSTDEVRLHVLRDDRAADGAQRAHGGELHRFDLVVVGKPTVQGADRERLPPVRSQGGARVQSSLDVIALELLDERVRGRAGRSDAVGLSGVATRQHEHRREGHCQDRRRPRHRAGILYTGRRALTQEDAPCPAPTESPCPA
jgi:hypothetical protein